LGLRSSSGPAVSSVLLKWKIVILEGLVGEAPLNPLRRRKNKRRAPKFAALCAGSGWVAVLGQSVCAMRRERRPKAGRCPNKRLFDDPRRTGGHKPARRTGPGAGVDLGLFQPPGGGLRLRPGRYRQPGVFLAVAESKGYRPSQPVPGRASIASALRPLQDKRAGVVEKRDRPCLLVFRNEAGTWRLIGYEGPITQLKLRSRN
jgi:hypothetical protein